MQEAQFQAAIEARYGSSSASAFLVERGTELMIYDLDTLMQHGDTKQRLLELNDTVDGRAVVHGVGTLPVSF